MNTDGFELHELNTPGEESKANVGEAELVRIITDFMLQVLVNIASYCNCKERVSSTCRFNGILAIRCYMYYETTLNFNYCTVLYPEHSRNKATDQAYEYTPTYFHTFFSIFYSI